MLRRAFILFFAVSFMAYLPACDSDDGGTTDDVVSETAGDTDTSEVTCDPACAATETCTDGACVADPNKVCDPECEAGFHCEMMACVADEMPECDPACEAGYTCTDGECVMDVCEPACEGLVCGDDGCEGTCGECDDDKMCSADQTECVCAPDCEGKVCGDDGCGGMCGTCMYGECAADQSACDCTPDCDGKVCGSDGCGDMCGECAGATICAADQSECTGDLTFGKASVFDALFIPGAADAIGDDVEAFDTLGGAACLDLSGDGAPNNGLGALLGTLEDFGVNANEEIQGMFDEGSMSILLDFGDAPVDGSEFTLTGFLGDGVDGDGAHLIDPQSYIDGVPMINFDGAKIDVDALSVGPITFPLGGLLAGALADAGIPPLDITLEEVSMTGTVTENTDDGLTINGGTMAGAIYKAELDLALYMARVWCDEDPEAPADICGYIAMANMPLIETFLAWDLEYEDCGKMLQLYGDDGSVIGTEENCSAVSACIFWSSAMAKISGLSAGE